VTAPARLLALRLQGFKSFAERTTVEFGPGISAVVGPNGSGKSNLADALRWALGEQGRSLRIRKSEDVIFAGSDRRSALGMADVALVIDNGDSLLPVEYEVLELGRRLYRSGENDYLLNRQRIRLRDLVDLLDAANLADNAFLFIGQGMVDQALSLRPEERRPLFEEVAGVRRHERRRRRSEEQLVEAEANLARVEDVLAELRPQARRLAAQAEQQATRRNAGVELAEAIVAVAHARWHEAAHRSATAVSGRDRIRAEADAAMAALTEAEERVAALAGRLEERAAAEASRRADFETARTRTTELRLRIQRLESDIGALDRDRARAEREQAAAEAERTAARRDLAVPVPGRDEGAEAALAASERTLGEALAELAALQAASREETERQAAVRRALAAREAELGAARRRADEAASRAGSERAAADERQAERGKLEVQLEATRAAAAAAREREAAATTAVTAARDTLEQVEAARAAAAERAAAAAEQVAGLTARVEEIDARVEADGATGISRAARRRGGRRLDEGLEVDPDLRGAVEAALGDRSAAYLVGRDEVAALAGERGSLVVREQVAASEGRTSDDGSRGLRTRVAAAGGGVLEDAVRLDPSGAARALLRRCLWVPTLDAGLQLQGHLPAGWLLVVRDGSAVIGPVGVELGRPDGGLGRRNEATRLRRELERLSELLDEQRQAAEAAVRRAGGARDALAAARREEHDAAAARRQADELERIAGRDLESVAREAAWHEAQADRAEADAARARASLEALAPAPADGADPVGASAGPGDVSGADADAVVAWQERVRELRAERDRLATQVAEVDASRRSAEGARARAEAATAMAEDRLRRSRLEVEAMLADRGRTEADLATARADLATAAAVEEQARDDLETLRAADAADRTRLAGIEREAAGARERLRLADDRLRRADVEDLEARLALDSIRESVLVELAGLGDPGARALAAALGEDRHEDPVGDLADASEGPDGGLPGPTDDGADDAARLETLLEAVAPRWASTPPLEDAPSTGRLASLRRRFHELGAANPFAAEEYDELRQRLEAMEAQQADLRSAIGSTRQLIGELDALITAQFQATFKALETAFDSRFQQLFGGGFARLSLTDPADLSATGVEIVARPPGKKPQTLAMLSGGERALTAVALLFAMLEVRPVPFCVLDEVDAALDEANIGRFTESLRSLAEQTQFIVITHNRGTIESADALYGVTVGDDSVSRVISLRLDEAQAIADAAGDGAVGRS
jgi:chromosome segregation protein